MELVRGTEAAALAAGRWMGRGDKNAADGAAVDAMRLVLNTVSMDGVVVIGEGEKDEAPMLYNGEEVGNGTPPQVDIAVDPLDGTTLTAHRASQRDLGDRGSPSAARCSTRARASTWTRSRWAPRRSTSIDIDAPVKANLEAVAKALGEDVDDITAVILDRPRHEDIIRRVPRGRRPHPAHPGRRRRRRDLGGVAAERAPTSCSASAARRKASSPRAR